MKTLALLPAAIGLCLNIGRGQEISLLVLPIVEPHQTVSITFAGSELKSQRGDKDPVIHPLTPATTEAIRKAIGSLSHEAWSGHWGSTVFLDGYEIIGRTNRDGKELTFSGSNGCPPGFSKIAKVLYDATKLEILRSGWTEMEESSRRYKNRDDFFESIIEQEKTKRDEAGTGQPATRSQSESEGGDKPQSEAEGSSR